MEFKKYPRNLISIQDQKGLFKISPASYRVTPTRLPLTEYKTSDTYQVCTFLNGQLIITTHTHGENVKCRMLNDLLPTAAIQH